jgi:hypothetical protein
MHAATTAHLAPTQPRHVVWSSTPPLSLKIKNKKKKKEKKKENVVYLLQHTTIKIARANVSIYRRRVVYSRRKDPCLGYERM